MLLYLALKFLDAVLKLFLLRDIGALRQFVQHFAVETELVSYQYIYLLRKLLQLLGFLSLCHDVANKISQKASRLRLYLFKSLVHNWITVVATKLFENLCHTFLGLIIQKMQLTRLLQHLLLVPYLLLILTDHSEPPLLKTTHLWIHQQVLLLRRHATYHILPKLLRIVLLPLLLIHDTLIQILVEFVILVQEDWIGRTYWLVPC